MLAATSGLRARSPSTSSAPISPPAPVASSDDGPRAGTAEILLSDPRAQGGGHRGEQVAERAGDDHRHPHPGPRGELAPAVGKIPREVLGCRPNVRRKSKERERYRTDPEARRVRGHGPPGRDRDDDDPRHDRAEDPRDRLRDAAQRVRLLEQSGADDQRQQAGRGRVEEPRRGAGDRLEHDQLPELRRARDQERCRQPERPDPCEVRAHHQPAARQPVGDDPADEDGEHERGARRGEDEPDVGHRAGQVEHGERHRQDEHCVAEDRDGLARVQERGTRAPRRTSGIMRSS